MPMKSKRQKSPPFPDVAIDVIDNAGKPLLTMPQSLVLRQKLRHRTVLVCLRNADSHIFLYKNPAGTGDAQGETWLPAIFGRVLSGESRHAAGVRLLDRVFGITGLEIYETARFTPPPAGPSGNVEVSLFLTAKTSIIPHIRDQEGMFVDGEEFRAILRDYPHMVTPLWNQVFPYLFPR